MPAVLYAGSPYPWYLDCPKVDCPELMQLFKNGSHAIPLQSVPL